MSNENKPRFTVITSEKVETTTVIQEKDKPTEYHSNPMYEKLLNFKNLQEQQKKKFSVDDLFKLC